MNMQDKIKDHGLTLVEINNGICYRIKDKIYYNKHLKQYPEWFDKILDHELRHSGKMSGKDLMMDMTEGDIIMTLGFCFNHPSAFTYFIPFTYRDNELAIDFNQLIIYFIIGLITFLIFI